MINIVLVDDETDMFPLFNIKFKKEIKKNKIKFNFFSSAVDALTFIKDTPCEDHQFIISDINMPDMDGLELLKNIKELNEEQKVYIISGYRTEEVQNHAQQLGADGFLEKPINFNQLRELILA